MIEFSLLRCKEYVVRHSHLDVDQDNQHVWEHQWDQFLTDFYLVCHENAKIQVSTTYSIQGLIPQKAIKKYLFCFNKLCSYFSNAISLKPAVSTLATLQDIRRIIW